MNRIQGIFRERVALVSLEVNGVRHDEVLVDTGYSGAVTLSEAFACRIGAASSHDAKVETFAEGKIQVRAADVTVQWFGGEVEVIALVLGEHTIIGMDLLYGTRMVVDEMNGVLTIEPAREGAA
ncbi:MAG: hypothetical protein HY719_10470 [Planctomycetes bacterium]|nr:hypothetical protein [Planctomycetota bacterium]